MVWGDSFAHDPTSAAKVCGLRLGDTAEPRPGVAGGVECLEVLNVLLEPQQRGPAGPRQVPCPIHERGPRAPTRQHRLARSESQPTSSPLVSPVACE